MQTRTTKVLSALFATLALVLSTLGFSVAANADTASNKDTIKVTEGTLTWGYKESWRNHMPSPILGGPGITTAKDGVTEVSKGGVFKWSRLQAPVTINKNGANTFTFSGHLQFQKYGKSDNYLVDTTFKNLRLRIEADKKKAVLLADVTYRKGLSMEDALTGKTADLVTDKNLEFGSVDLSKTSIDYSAEKIDVTNAQVTLTEDPVGGGQYKGKVVDPLSFTLKLTHEKASGPEKETQPAPAKPGELVIDPVAEDDAQITGTGKAKQSVTMTVKIAEEEFKFLGSAKINDSGKWTFNIPEGKKDLIKKDRTLVAYQDSDYKKIEKKIVGKGEKPAVPTSSEPVPSTNPAPAPGTFKINPVGEGDKEITGYAKANDYAPINLKLEDETVVYLGKATADGKGVWKLELSEENASKLKVGTIVSGYQGSDYKKDEVKVVAQKDKPTVTTPIPSEPISSEPAPAPQPDGPKPADSDVEFKLNPVKASDKSVKGTGKPNARIAVMVTDKPEDSTAWVFIGITNANEKGEWEIKTDKLVKYDVLFVTETPKGTTKYSHEKLYKIERDIPKPADNKKNEKDEIKPVDFKDDGKVAHINSGEMSWGYVATWRDYVNSQIGGSVGKVKLDGLNQLDKYVGYGWPKLIPMKVNKKGINEVSFPGSVQFQKHGLMIDTTIKNVRIRFYNSTQATIVADVAYRKGAQMGVSKVVPIVEDKNIEIAKVDLSKQPIDFNKEKIEVTNAPTTITYIGGAIVGGELIYPGNPGDRLSFKLNLSQSDKANHNDRQTVRAGDKIDLTAPANKGTKVKFFLFSTPVLLGEAVAGDDNVARLTATIPANTTGGLHTVRAYEATDSAMANPLVEKLLDVVAGFANPASPLAPKHEPQLQPAPKPGKVVAPIAPAPEVPAKAEPRCVADPNVRGVTNGKLIWGFKRSFYGYMLSGTAGHPAGKITPRAGASLSGGVFHFQAAHAGSMINTTTKTGRINFAGNVNFYKYNGILNMTISNPSLVITGPTTGYLEVSVSSTDMNGKPVIPGRVRFADVRFANAKFSKNNFSANTSSVTLTARGAKAFAGYYQAGTAMDNFSINANLSDKVTCYDANGNPIKGVLSNTGTNSNILTMFFVLVVLASVVGGVNLYRKNN